MMRGCILLIALSTISLVVVLARSAIHLLRTDEVTANAIEGGHIPRTRSLLQMPLSGLPPSGSSMSNDYPFSVIIISYHKTGVSLDCILLPQLFLKNAMHETITYSIPRAKHDLQMDLVDAIVNEFPDVGPRLTEFGDKSPLKRRRHPATTPCTRIGKYLQTGHIMVQHA